MQTKNAPSVGTCIHYV